MSSCCTACASDAFPFDVEVVDGEGGPKLRELDIQAMQTDAKNAMAEEVMRARYAGADDKAIERARREMQDRNASAGRSK